MNKFYEAFGGVVVIAGFGLIIAGICGWIANIVKLVTTDVYGFFEVIRAIGVIAAPLGAVLGYI